MDETPESDQEATTQDTQRRRRSPGSKRSNGDVEKPSTAGLAGWLAGRLPDQWYTEPPTVTVDRDEILVVGPLSAPDVEGADDVAKAAAEMGRITRFREETREERMAIAREAEHLFWRHVAWGARVGGTRRVFTNLSVPVMTRLRQRERLVLDTLVESGVARSRSDALSWCVKLVADNTERWLTDLRTAMETVESVRKKGPSVS